LFCTGRYLPLPRSDSMSYPPVRSSMRAFRWSFLLIDFLPERYAAQLGITFPTARGFKPSPASWTSTPPALHGKTPPLQHHRPDSKRYFFPFYNALMRPARSRQLFPFPITAAVLGAVSPSTYGPVLLALASHPSPLFLVLAADLMAFFFSPLCPGLLGKKTPCLKSDPLLTFLCTTSIQWRPLVSKFRPSCPSLYKRRLISLFSFFRR